MCYVLEYLLVTVQNWTMIVRKWTGGGLVDKVGMEVGSGLSSLPRIDL